MIPTSKASPFSLDLSDASNRPTRETTDGTAKATARSQKKDGGGSDKKEKHGTAFDTALQHQVALNALTPIATPLTLKRPAEGTTQAQLNQNRGVSRANQAASAMQQRAVDAALISIKKSKAAPLVLDGKEADEARAGSQRSHEAASFAQAMQAERVGGSRPADKPVAPAAVPPVIQQHAVDDSSLSMSLMKNAAHITLDTGETGRLSLHVRMQNGNADIRAEGLAAPKLATHSVDLQLALSKEGLQMRQLEVSTGNSTNTGSSSYQNSPGAHSQSANHHGSDQQQRHAAGAQEDARQTPSARSKRSTDADASSTTSMRGDRILHVKA